VGGEPVISWIVASHDQGILEANLLASLGPFVAGTDDEIVIVRDASSIADAYNRGAALANQALRCYVHHDVSVLAPEKLRARLAEHCTESVGMVGVIGSRTPVMPWWQGDTTGNVIDARSGRLWCGRGGEPAAYLDGLLLATAQDVTWDEAYPGWHGYDHDMCQQMLAAGLTNYCLEDGAGLVAHNTSGSLSTARLHGWSSAVEFFRHKWNSPPPSSREA
jgi:hypothetical protein